MEPKSNSAFEEPETDARPMQPESPRASPATGRSSVLLRTLTVADASAASDLILISFQACIAPDWTAEACTKFMEETAPKTLAAEIESAALKLGAFAADPASSPEAMPALVGVLLMPLPERLRMLFVHPARIRQGIGRSLWEAARAELTVHHPKTVTVELNASPYAVPFYRVLGFAPISAEYSVNGCRATRMACWLPAREYKAELPVRQY